MEEDRFWDLVELLAAADQDDLPLTDEEVAGFAERWHAAKDHADYIPLREALTVAFGHCGDDTFDDLRGRLVLRGRQVYEHVLADPDSVLDFLDPTDRAQHPQIKSFMVYPPGGSVPRGIPSDPAEHRARYPRCTAAREAYIASSLPTVAVPVDSARQARTLAMGKTWAPRPRR